MKLITKDELWKAIIEELFVWLMRFFYPDEIHLFDLSKGFEFLDKELIRLFPEAKNTRRYADKLIKVYMRDGSTKWILIHIEVQGYADPNFAKRMFIYFYRILDKYQKPITALAIFTDKIKSFHPKKYETTFLRTKLTYEFDTYKLLDKTPEDFADMTNPFAAVMETAWYALQNDTLDDDHLFNFKFNLIRRLKEQGHDNDLIRRVFRFIEYYVSFENPEINRKFEKEINTILQNKEPMGIQETVLANVRRQTIEEERKQMIINLRKEGFSDERIVKILNITVAEILCLTEDNE